MELYCCAFLKLRANIVVFCENSSKIPQNRGDYEKSCEKRNYTRLR